MPTPVLPLEYAAPGAAVDAHARRAFGQMVIVAVLSGLCVGACFLSFTEHPLAWVLHVGIFAATIIIAVAAGVNLSKVAGVTDHDAQRTRLTLDMLAAAGLAIIGVAPIVWYITSPGNPGAGVLLILGFAYALLAGTTWRHVLLYRFLAELCRGASQEGLSRGLVAMGWCKAIYEALWLGCCAMALLTAAIRVGDPRAGSDWEGLIVLAAIPAFFGALGFGAVWIWMIVMHAVLYRQTRAYQ